MISTFETNIRMLGGLLGGHSTALDLADQGRIKVWGQFFRVLLKLPIENIHSKLNIDFELSFDYEVSIEILYIFEDNRTKG